MNYGLKNMLITLFGFQTFDAKCSGKKLKRISFLLNLKYTNIGSYYVFMRKSQINKYFGLKFKGHHKNYNGCYSRL